MIFFALKTRIYSLQKYKIRDRIQNRKTRMNRLLTTLPLSAGSVQMINPSSIPDSEMTRLSALVVVYLCYIQN
jgi:hypothetical protein